MESSRQITRREHLVHEITRLRDVEGLKFHEIGAALGIALTTAHNYYRDPTGEKTRDRKRAYERPCAGCGRTINPNGPSVTTVRCLRCHRAHETEIARTRVIAAISAWADENGGIPPSAVDWNPGLAEENGYPEKAAAYRAAGHKWPPVGTVQRLFGSWNDGIAAAGFTPRASGGGPGRYLGDEPEVQAEAVKRYRDGESAYAIACDIGVAGSSVIKWARKEGVPIRRRADYQYSARDAA